MSDLFSKSEKEYGGDYCVHYFEQYKLYIESMEKISDRRQYANNYFITINTALISLIGISSQINFFESIIWIKYFLALIGIIICITFGYLVKSYKQLNEGKFKVIHQIEEKLPLAIYKYEWEILGSGKDKNKYYPFSHIELIIPWIFGIIYTILGICSLF
ncbi:MAG: hypothetical protein PHG83_03330 [Patescibacteria group bacterium]|nr:hypothetical protein [Patescibacteria group bacterium]